MTCYERRTVSIEGLFILHSTVMMPVCKPVSRFGRNRRPRLVTLALHALTGRTQNFSARNNGV
jgi:hypothetical protein